MPNVSINIPAVMVQKAKRIAEKEYGFNFSQLVRHLLAGYIDGDKKNSKVKPWDFSEKGVQALLDAKNDLSDAKTFETVDEMMEYVKTL